MAGIFPSVPKALWIVVFLVVNTGVNYIGISFTAIVNRLFLAAELLFIVVFIVMAVVAISRGTGGAHFTTTPAVRLRRVHPADSSRRPCRSRC